MKFVFLWIIVGLLLCFIFLVTIPFVIIMSLYNWKYPEPYLDKICELTSIIMNLED